MKDSRLRYSRCAAALIVLSLAGLCTGQVSVAPASFNFGEVAEGSVSNPQVFRIINAGRWPVAITSVALTGRDAADFVLVPPGVTIIGAGRETQFSVTFAPLLTGIKSAAVEVSILGIPTISVAISATSGLPLSLRSVPVPEPDGLDEIVRDRTAAIQLGKALFWDMQVGSDGIQSCASCHFHAGADNRPRNAISTGLLDRRYAGIPGDLNYTSGDTAWGNSTIPGIRGFRNFKADHILTAADFPLHLRRSPADEQASVLFRYTNDVVSSQGVLLHQYMGVQPGYSVDDGTALADTLFQTGGMNVRRVEPRHTPSVINAVFNFANFWDGRANHIFNGVNPFGPLDRSSGVFVTGPTSGLEIMQLRLNNSSLASQAVGPPGSDFEMSYRGRTLPDIGRKLLVLRPLQYQVVHPADSVLAPLRGPQQRGLNTTYYALVQKAFQPRFWERINKLVRYEGDTSQIVDYTECPPAYNEFFQVEANFALFFGLAVQMYQATLVSDDTPFDRYLGAQGAGIDGNPDALTEQQKRGLEIFLGPGKCINCHSGPELTNASVQNAQNGANLIEFMPMADGDAFYDNGFYNIGLRTPLEEPARAGTAPFINPLTNEPFPLSFTKLAMLKRDGLLPNDVAMFVPDLPAPQDFNRTAIDGATKTPGLRNIELMGPYFSNGYAGTLMQTVNFYVRGANFPRENIANLAPDIVELRGLQGNTKDKEALVAFMMALTDERVRQEQAPFDHPQLFLPVHGVAPDLNGALSAAYMYTELPAVGASGRPAEGLPPLGTFLGLDPMQGDQEVTNTMLSDFNADGVVNNRDFGEMAAAWNRQGPDEMDISGPNGVPDGRVDWYDLAMFASAWLN
ncbi:MAG: choice-of-anchor D domain-containing protein [Phycisphaerae bacterium]|nr:choice-of-anchor D domain-containing protein [Phycisphaerae bacterium]